MHNQQEMSELWLRCLEPRNKNQSLSLKNPQRLVRKSHLKRKLYLSQRNQIHLELTLRKNQTLQSKRKPSRQLILIIRKMSELWLQCLEPRNKTQSLSLKNPQRLVRKSRLKRKLYLSQKNPTHPKLSQWRNLNHPSKNKPNRSLIIIRKMSEHWQQCSGLKSQSLSP